MKRIGNLIKEIIKEENLLESFHYVLRTKKRQNSRSGRHLIKNKDKVIKQISYLISSGNFKISEYREYTINERGKERLIQSIPLRDRIILNAIMRVVEKHLNKRFISDSAASIKGKGGHYLFNRMIRDMKKDPRGTFFVYKCDIKKFYQSIDQNKMIYVLTKVFKDKTLIKLLTECIRLIKTGGLSIGLRTSQALGNLYLDYYLDHKLKDLMGVKYYRRYCDDIVVQSGTLEDLTRIIRVIKSCVKDAGLTIKSNEQVFSILHRDIDFLGFRVFQNGQIKIRTHIKKRFAKRWKRVKSWNRKVKLIGSFYGIIKHSNSNNLLKKLIGINMKNFKDFGLVYEAEDGKKRFDCQLYTLNEILNQEIIILDYEIGIKTSQGENRYVVEFSMDNKTGKFFTNSSEMKQMLDKIRKLPDGFPFVTTIKRVFIGKNITKYSFN